MRRCCRSSARTLLALALFVLFADAAAADDTASPSVSPQVYVLGGPSAVSDDTLARLRDLLGGQVRRLSGTDRYATAAAVSASHFVQASTVVIASGESYADSLSAGPAAARLNGPILLTTRTSLPPSTEAELDRLRPSQIVIAGGPAAVGPTLAAQLGARGATVRRVSGPDRYATSAALSQVAAPRGADTVFLTSGSDFADAMSGAAPAAVHHGTILLADAPALHPAVRAEITRLAPEEIVILGGEHAVPTRLADQMRASTGVPYRRVAGADRFITNAEVSRTFYPRGADVVFIANAGRFADAMVVGAVAEGGNASSDLAMPQNHAPIKGVLLYTHDLKLPLVVERELERLEEEHQNAQEPSETPSPDASPSETVSPIPSSTPGRPSTPNKPPAVDLNGAVAGEDAAVSFTENASPVLLAPDALVTDTDDANLAGATITLTNALDGAQESLVANGPLPGGITAAAYDAGTGTLALSGSAPVASYQSALRLISYTDADDTPTTNTARSVTVIVTDGSDPSTARSSNITVTAANDAPVIDLSGSGTAGDDLTGRTFTEGGEAVEIAPDAAVTDPESDSLTGMTVTLQAAPDDTDESLAAPTIPDGIAAAYEPDTRTLSLSGTASAADYQQALRAITYANAAANANAADRVVEVTATDGDSSTARTSTITMSVVNDAPTLDLNGGVEGFDATSSFTENGATALLAAAAEVTDLDSDNLTGATFTITNAKTSDLIAATDALPEGISATAYDADTGAYALSGTATVAEYQQAIRLIGFDNVSDTPDTTARTVTVTVTDGTDTSAQRTATVSVTAVNDPPVVDLNGDSEDFDLTGRSFTEDGAAVAIAPVATITDPEGDNLTGLTVTISARPDGDSESLAVGALPEGITAEAYDDTTGTLALSGTASAAHYQTALRAITYANVSQNPNTTARIVSVTATDGGVSIERTSTVGVVGAADAPTLGLNTTPGTDVARTFAVGGSAVTIAPAAVVADADGTITGATITIDGRHDGDGDETLDVTPPEGITKNWNPTNGVLSLAGSASPAAYQTALRAVTYDNVDATPTEGARTVTVTVTDGTTTTAAQTSTVTVSTNTAPVADDHTYTDAAVFVNVLFVSGGGSPVTEAQTTHALTLLDDATDDQDDTLTVTDLQVTTGNGTAELLDEDTGAFSYEPTSSGTHVLTYEISDGNLTDTGTVTIDVDADKVVFVKSGADGSGTSTDPVGTLAAAQDAAGAGDTIFVSVGDGEPYTGGIVMESAQRLIGRPSGLTLSHGDDSVEVVSAGATAKPVIGNTGGAGVVMADGATVDGIAVTQTSQPGITGGAGTATIRNTAVTTTTAAGIDLATGTYTLSGGVTVTTTTGTALKQSSGTVTVSGSGNTLSAVGGQALDLSNAVVSGGMEFDAISTDGGANGITFSPSNGDDAGAFLTVEGATGDTSGGTLTHHTGDAVVATAGSLSLSKMLIADNGGRAISATGTTGLTLDTVEVRGNGDAASEHSVQLTNVTGSHTVNAGTFSDGSGDLIHLANTNRNTTLSITGSTFQDVDAEDDGARGLVIFADGTSAVTASVTGSTFTPLDGAGVLFATGTVSGGSGSSSLTFRGNSMTGTSARPTNLDVRPAGSTTVTLIVGGPDAEHENTLTGTAEPFAGAVSVQPVDSANVRATVQRNIVDGSRGYGILVLASEGNDTRVLVRDNTVSSPYAEGIWLGNSSDVGNSPLDGTILSNTITGAGTFNNTVGAIRFEAFDDVVCSDIALNDVTGTINGDDITLETQAGTHTYVMTEEAPVTPDKISTRNNNATKVSFPGEDAIAPGKHDAPSCLQP